MALLGIATALAGAALITFGAELFAEHLAAAARALGVSTFALALLLAGAEPEELATAVTAALRDVPGVALGDVIGANVTMCLVALGLAALVAPVPFTGSVRRYALGGLAVGAVAVVMARDGSVGRPEGLVLVLVYAALVAVVWRRERRPPSLGEVAELTEPTGRDPAARRRWSREVVLAVAGVALLALGSVALVESVRRLTGVERTQTVLGLTLVGFATAFELVVLAWSSARRGLSDTVVAAVVGSYAYNVTMTLGAAALARPLRLAEPARLTAGSVAMLAALLLVLALAGPREHLGRAAGVVLLAGYPLYVALVVLS